MTCLPGATMPADLLDPAAVLALLRRRYVAHAGGWLDGGGNWPMVVGLGPPTEARLRRDPAAVRTWVREWTESALGPLVEFEIRRWPVAGDQHIPVRLNLPGPRDLAWALGLTAEWDQVADRARRWCDSWPGFSGRLAPFFPVFRDYCAADFTLLGDLLGWLLAHPAPGCYLREIPLPGLDTKWLEAHSREVLRLGLLLRPPASDARPDLATWAGLKTEEPRLLVRVLDPELRAVLGGLGEVRAPVSELARLDWRPSRVLVVENRTSGIALPDLPGTVALIGLGNGVGVLEGLPWLQAVSAWYWGDLDTWGLVILQRARKVLPQLRSVLMDAATLLAFQRLWGQEPSPDTSTACPDLSPAEADVLEGLRQGRWGDRVRLEQERIPWDYALAALKAALLPDCPGWTGGIPG